MRILLLGKNGQLGWELNRALQPLGQVTALDYPAIDMANAISLRKVVQEHQPNVIVNATAYTAVDKAESEPELAELINSTASRVLAEEAKTLNAALIHYSTDYVFDGTKGKPYTESDTPNPLSVYGKSKLYGEQAIQSVGGIYVILRTAWMYSRRRDSFVTKVLEWARKNELLQVVDDQVSNPTWARMMAETTALLLARGDVNFLTWLDERKGLYHLAGSGFVSRFEWAEQILKLDPNPEQQVTRRLERATTSDFPMPAQRPLFSALDCGKFEDTFGLKLPDWKNSLQLTMTD